MIPKTCCPRPTAGLAVLACILALCSAVLGQEFRGSVTGIVTDATGAVLPGAKVAVTNVETGTTNSTSTNAAGEYRVLYVLPGMYKVEVEATGFKRLVRENIEIRVNDAVRVDLSLTVGDVQESVNVTAETPLLETESASAGQVIDRRRVSELPLADGNPFILARLAPGMINTGSLQFTRAFDNNATSQVLSNGAPGGNEFTLDGTPNTADSRAFGQRVAYVPPADAVQEFKVVTSSFDAQQGRTAGANINVALRSGTNDLHGSAYEFLRNDKLSANGFFLNRGRRPRDPMRYHRFGATLGGPIYIPKLYDGRNKTFFFFGFERLAYTFPKINQFTVPTEAQRNGNFSNLLSQGIRIYDPLSARREGARIVRTPFPNNIIPSDRISPIGKAFAQYFPLPNQPGDAQGRNNLISPDPDRDRYHTESVRVDHSLNEKQRFFVRWTYNNRSSWQYGPAALSRINNIIPSADFQGRINNGAGADYVYVASPSVVFNLRLGFNRFEEPRGNDSDNKFDPASLGWSNSVLNLFGGTPYLPQAQVFNYARLGGRAPRSLTHTVYSLQPTVTLIRGAHSIRFGYDGRSYRENAPDPGFLLGRYDFSNDFTRENDLGNSGQPVGQQFASLLLGFPTGGVIDRNALRANVAPFNAGWIQDDWKITPRLSVNLGLRYEFEGATTERYNRNVRGIDLTSANPIEAAARAAYAANPIPQISASDFRVRGGLMFADGSNRGFWNSDRNNFQPRVGLAWSMSQKTVLRAGWGIFMAPFGISGLNMPGFSQATLLVPTLDNGLTFRANLANPFPEGVAVPPGSSQGLGTFLGRDLGSGGSPIAGLDRSNALSRRVQFSIQRELPMQMVVEAGYVHSRAYDLRSGAYDLNAVPRQYLSTSPVRDEAAITFLGANVANPFATLIPGTGLNGSVVTRAQLLRPYPQFGSIWAERYDGNTDYNALQLRAEKRFSRGYTLMLAYTWSKLLEEAVLMNAVDTGYERRLAGEDAPHRVVVSGIWELPFGRGRAFGASWNRWVNGFAGGWQVQGIYQYQTGFPLTLGNVYYNGSTPLRTDISSSTIDAVLPASGFYFTDAAVQTNGVLDPAKQRNDLRIRLESNIRTLPTRFAGLRGDSQNMFDLSAIKNIGIVEGVNLQFRAEFLNAFNTPLFGNINLNPRDASFGRAQSQDNLPRNIQLALRLVF